MRNEIETLILKYGPYWICALCGVALQKLFAKEPTTLFKVFRSSVGSVVCSMLIALNFEVYLTFEKMCFVLFMVGLSVDIIIPKLIETGPKLVDTLIKSFTDLVIKLITKGDKE